MAFKFLAVLTFAAAVVAVAAAGIIPVEHHELAHALSLDEQHQHHQYLQQQQQQQHHELHVQQQPAQLYTAAVPTHEHEHVAHYAQQQQPLVHHQAVAPSHVLLQKHQLVAHQPHYEQYPDDPHPQYKFAYDVQDDVSGDSKSQSESRDGDVVQGEYSLTDADGFRRTVKYTADSVNGFNAVVHREPLGHKVVAAAPVQYHQQHAHQPALYATSVTGAAPAPTTVVKYAAAAQQPTYAPLSAAHYEHQHQPQEHTAYEHADQHYYHQH